MQFAANVVDLPSSSIEKPKDSIWIQWLPVSGISRLLFEHLRVYQLLFNRHKLVFDQNKQPTVELGSPHTHNNKLLLAYNANKEIQASHATRHNTKGKRHKYLFCAPIRTDDRIENLGNYCILDQVLALYTDTLDGKMGMLAMFSMRPSILLRLLYCTPLISLINFEFDDSVWWEPSERAGRCSTTGTKPKAHKKGGGQKYRNVIELTLAIYAGRYCMAAESD